MNLKSLGGLEMVSWGAISELLNLFLNEVSAKSRLVFYFWNLLDLYKRERVIKVVS